VRINTPGESGPILLGAPVTRVASLSQNTGVDSTVETAGKVLQTSGVSVPAGKASVTIGAAAGSGTLAAIAAGGDLALNSDAGGGITVNAVVANNGSASSLTKTGSGDVKLAAPNTFSGVTTIGGGALVLADGKALQNSTLSTGGAVFDSSVDGHAFTVGGCRGPFPKR